MNSNDEKNKLNINLASIKDSQEKKDSFYRVNSEEYQARLEKIKADREITKKAIINKVKAQTNEKQQQLHHRESSLHKTPKIKKPSGKLRETLSFVKNRRQVGPKQMDIELEQEKLSYTLQMDLITDKNRQKYRREKKQLAEAKIYDTFAKLDPKLTHLYYLVCGSLLLLILICSGIIYLNQK